MHDNAIPWKDIVISGHVLSDSKEKLSKSKENAKLTPEHLLETYSADAIRYWTASGSLGHDVPFSENQLKIGLRLITKLWNAFRFIHEHIGHTQPESVETLGAVNEWILHRAAQTFDAYKHQYKTHEFGLALHQIEPFFWNDFCDNYLELVKDQLFHPELYSQEQVNATKYTLYTVGLQILQWYAPYLPYITETIYQQIYKPSVDTSSLHITQFAELQKTYNFPDSVFLLNAIVSIINSVRKLKTEKQLSLKVELATLTCHSTQPELTRMLTQHEQLIKGITKAHAIKYDAQIIPNMLEQQGETWVADVSVTL
jgi:valyl-tRNA synthetase